MKVAYNPKYVAARHSFETTRKAKLIAEKIRQGWVPEAELIDPTDWESQAVRAIEKTHDSAYIEALRTGHPTSLSQSQGFEWDPGVWTMAVASTAGVLAAVDWAMNSQSFAASLSSGLHHAARDRGKGFCTVNGLAIGAKRAAEKVDGSVVILDLDAHCGGGTFELLCDSPQIVQLDLSISSFDQYSPTQNHRLEIFSGESDEEYLKAVANLLKHVPKDAGFLLYNAGVDPHPVISEAALNQREHLVAQWCAENRIPAAFVLAGGYLGSLDIDGLIELHLATIKAFTQQAPALPVVDLQ